METGDILRRVRLNLGLTKRDASALIGVTDKTYRSYERGGVDFVKFCDIISRLGGFIEVTRIVRIETSLADPIVIREVL